MSINLAEVENKRKTRWFFQPLLGVFLPKITRSGESISMKLKNRSRLTVNNGTHFYSSFNLMVDNASDLLNTSSHQVINSPHSDAEKDFIYSDFCEKISAPKNSYQVSPYPHPKTYYPIFSEKKLQQIRDCCKDQKSFENLQQILMEARGEELEKDRLKDVILHTVAHDLRTSVLGTLMLFQHLMSQPEEMVTISHSVVDRLVQGNKRHLEMINALLETYFPEDEALILERSIRFSALLKKISKNLVPIFQKNQLKLINLVPASLPPVLADPVQIQRVFETLITHISERNPPGLTLTLNAKVEGKMMRCWIAHNGAPISPVECHHIFDLYIGEAHHRYSTITDLKLYLCRQIIRSLNGEIGVDLSPDAGVTFWFTLPLAAAVSEKS